MGSGRHELVFEIDPDHAVGEVEDRTVDLQWGFPTRSLPWFQGNQAWGLIYDSFVHELGHARTLVDVYAWDVHEDRDLIERDGPDTSIAAPTSSVARTGTGS